MHCREAEDFSGQIHSPSLKPNHNKKSIIIHLLLQKFAQPLYFPMQKYYHLFYPFLQQPSYYCPEVTCNATLKFLDIYASKRIQNLHVFTARPRSIFALPNLDTTSNNLPRATAAIDAVILIILFLGAVWYRYPILLPASARAPTGRCLSQVCRRRSARCRANSSIRPRRADSVLL